MRNRRTQFLGAATSPGGMMPSGPLPSDQPPQRQYVKDFYVYGFNTVGGIAPAGTFIGNILIDADSDFQLVKLTQFSDIAAAGQTEATRIVPLVTMDIVDAGSGRKLFSTPQAMGAIFGNGDLPFILPVPRIFTARSSIAITLANFDAANSYNVRLAFIGAKLFAGTPNPYLE